MACPFGVRFCFRCGATGTNFAVGGDGASHRARTVFGGSETPAYRLIRAPAVPVSEPERFTSPE